MNPTSPINFLSLSFGVGVDDKVFKFSQMSSKFGPGGLFEGGAISNKYSNLIVCLVRPMHNQKHYIMGSFPLVRQYSCPAMQ